MKWRSCHEKAAGRRMCAAGRRLGLAVLEELGQDLRGDEEKICKAISLAGKRLEKQLAEWDERRAETEKRTTALWFSASALLVILLI